MRRILSTAAFITLAGVSSNLAAVGLGRIETDSGLNEPLSARIPLMSASEAELRQIRVELASAERFQQSDMPRPFYLTRLNFQIKRGDDGKPFVRITSERPVTEPFLDFLVNVEWPQGSLLREFTVLLDPPVYTDEPVAPAPGQAIAQGTQAMDDGEAAAGPATSMSSVGSGGARSSSTSSGSTYGPVQANDTLWSIASEVRPQGASVRQTMIALLRANPEAFIDSNINRLKRGAVLRLPDGGEAITVSDTEARRAVNEQMQAWRDAAPKPAGEGERAEPAPAQEETPTPSVAAADSDEPASSGELRVLAPQGSGGEDTSENLVEADLAASPENISRLQNELAVEQETNASLKSELTDKNAELKAMRAELKRLESAVNVDANVTIAGEGEAAYENAAAGTETPVPSADARASGDVSAQDVADADEAGLAVNDAAGSGSVSEQAFPAKNSSEPEFEAVERKSGAGVADAQPETASEATPRADNENDTASAATDNAQKAPEPAEQRASTGPVSFVLETLLANRLLLLGAGGLLLLMIILLLIMRRRGRGDREELSASTAPAPRERTEDADTTQQDGDPIEQADFLVAYGRYADAQGVLDDALGAEPDNVALRMKLLEILARRGDQSGFEAEAQVLRTQLDSDDDPQWQQVVAMGRDIVPDHPLFSDNEGQIAAEMPGATNVELPRDVGYESAPAAQQPVELSAADKHADPALNFELEPGEGESTVAQDASDADEDTGASLPEAASSEGDDTLDFEWSIPEASSDTAATDTVAEAGESSNNGLDFELPSDSLDTSTAPETQGDTPSQRDNSDGLDEFDFDELTMGWSNRDDDDAPAGSGNTVREEDMDEVTTKLDLARVYMDMGDVEGARSLLDEVLQEGDTSQRHEAEGLLRKAG